MRRVQSSAVSCCTDIYVGAAGQHSSSLLTGGQVHQLKVAVWLMTDVGLSGITVHQLMPGLFIDLCIVFNFDLAWEDIGKLQLILAAFL